MTAMFFFSFRMGKTKAQRQREYRARLKEKDEQKYLKDARERQKRNYIPVKRLSKSDIEQRHTDTRERVRKSRAAAKQRVKETREKEPEPVEMSLDAATNRKRTLLGNIEASGTMFVKLNFSQPKKGESTKKRKRLSAERKRKEIQKLKCKNESLKRKTERLYKRIQRQKIAKTEGSSPNLPETSPSEIQNETFTPRRKVDSEIREAGVSPSVKPKPIRNKLLFANVISEEIKIASKNSNNEDQQAIRNVIS